MTQDGGASARNTDRTNVVYGHAGSKWRAIFVLLIVLGIVGWRYGWPARSWETTVCPLEEIDWQTAVRLCPQCIGSASGDCGARSVFLVEGSLDEEKKPVLDLENTRYGDPQFARLCRNILQELVFPDLSGRCFRVGVFWVDTPAGYGDAVTQAHDPAPGVFASC